MKSDYEFPIQLFRETSSSPSSRRSADSQHLAAMFVQSAKNDHWFACLIRHKLRFQMKTFEIFKRAFQNKDSLAIERWYLPGLHKGSGFFSDYEVDLLESIASKAAGMSINPILDLERGIDA